MPPTKQYTTFPDPLRLPAARRRRHLGSSDDSVTDWTLLVRTTIAICPEFVTKTKYGNLHRSTVDKHRGPFLNIIDSTHQNPGHQAVVTGSDISNNWSAVSPMILRLTSASNGTRITARG